MGEKTDRYEETKGIFSSVKADANIKVEWCDV
jgi:hypothetical protein